MGLSIPFFTTSHLPPVTRFLKEGERHADGCVKTVNSQWQFTLQGSMSEQCPHCRQETGKVLPISKMISGTPAKLLEDREAKELLEKGEGIRASVWEHHGAKDWGEVSAAWKRHPFMSATAVPLVGIVGAIGGLFLAALPALLVALASFWVPASWEHTMEAAAAWILGVGGGGGALFGIGAALANPGNAYDLKGVVRKGVGADGKPSLVFVPDKSGHSYEAGKPVELGVEMDLSSCSSCPSAGIMPIPFTLPADPSHREGIPDPPSRREGIPDPPSLVETKPEAALVTS